MIGYLRNLVVQDFWLKLFSLGLAGLVWFTVAMLGGKSPTRALPLGPVQKRTFSSLPVVVMSSAADARSFRVEPKEVDVTVQGDRKTIESLQGKEIRVTVDLTGIEMASSLLKRLEVSAPAGVSDLAVQPREVQVIFPGTNQ